ncbi:TetR/AcrR family transcriptional regulator [Paeniglutamicibacter sp. R2-26]|uniref:TetR/AcrR family transcriptional regulator n=1 Tax=Paeniglutamicibacter sp. R2-26 TaxID=3144417 RepID=UPI003EE5F977
MGESAGRQRPARERLLRAAADLFYAQGIAATGIDAVTAQAGVARKSLYNNFASKDELVLTYLTERHLEWLELHRQRAAGARTARELVLAVFDAYIDHAESAYSHGFRGCGLLNAAAELPAGAPGRESVREHKEEVESLLAAALAEDLGAERAAETAEQLSFLLEGAVARAGLEGTAERLVRARTMAAALVDGALAGAA